MFSFVRNHQNIFRSDCTILHFYQQNESSCGFTCFPAFGVGSVLDYRHSDSAVVVSHFCFNMSFPDDI